jgi:hypothetical protein
MMRASLVLGLLMAFMLFATSIDLPADPADVTLAWDPNVAPGLAGYNVYYGTASRAYSERISVSSTATSATVTNLQAGQTYYFAVTAINFAGLESGYSAEVFYTTPNAVALQIQVASNGQVILTVTGLAGHIYDIQASSDFTAWSVIATVTLGSGGLAEFADLPPQIATAVLYRVVEAFPPSLQIRVASNRWVILTVTGPAGRSYDIQASSDFTTWTVIGNATVGVGGSFVFTDTSAANFPRRFYRARDTQP